jgi:hypothetical protein
MDGCIAIAEGTSPFRVVRCDASLHHGAISDLRPSCHWLESFAIGRTDGGLRRLDLRDRVDGSDRSDCRTRLIGRMGRTDGSDGPMDPTGQTDGRLHFHSRRHIAMACCAFRCVSASWCNFVSYAPKPPVRTVIFIVGASG